MSRIVLLQVLILAAVTPSFTYPRRQTYIIHMDNTAMDQAFLDTEIWYHAVVSRVTKFLVQEDGREEEMQPRKILYTYRTSLSGFAVQLSPQELNLLLDVEGVLRATPDHKQDLHTTHSSQFLGLQAGKGLWKNQLLASDVIIGVLDTGIWPEHPSFDDSSMPLVPSRWKGACETGTDFSILNCNKKIIGARAYFKGYEAAYGKINESSHYKSARDSDGHGTQIASIAAGNVVRGASMFGLANGSAVGMSNSARIAVYKVCWGACFESDILAGMEDAVTDGVDVLSLSLGGISGLSPPGAYDTDTIAIGAFRAIQKGVFVSCSAGNGGPYKSTVRNAAPWVMTVAASYTDRSFPTTIKLGNGEVLKGASLYSGKKTKMLPLVYGETAGDHNSKYCAHGSLRKKFVKGKIVVCEEVQGTSVGDYVKMTGAACMLILSSGGEDLVTYADVLPASSLGATASEAIKRYVKTTKKPTASITFDGATYGNPAPVMTYFSSRGPNEVGPDVIKPDVTAPGKNILAAWPPTISITGMVIDKRRAYFNIVSGTSMSCPHVSGLAALLKAIHTDWSPASIKSALMTSAYTQNNKGAPILDLGFVEPSPATSFVYGSGHVDPERAADPGLVYDISPDDYLEYLCSLDYTRSQIAVMSGANYSCNSSGVRQPGDLNYPSFVVQFEIDAPNVTFTFKRTLTNVGEPGRYRVRVTEPEGVSIIVKPRFLTFQKMSQKLSYKVKFVPNGRKSSIISSFGSLSWGFGKYSVRSPVAVTWKYAPPGFVYIKP